MEKKDNKKLKLRIAGIVIAIVVVYTMVPTLIIGIGMLTHHEPFITADSYEELKKVFSKEESFVFPDALLEWSSYKYGHASLNNDGIRGYELTVDHINESEFSNITIKGIYTKYTLIENNESIPMNIINMDNVEIKEMYYDNEETENTIVYEFELENTTYTILISTDKEYNDCIQERIYPNNQELLNIAKMIIEQPV